MGFLDADEDADTAALGFVALGFLASRLERFWDLAMGSSLGRTRAEAAGGMFTP